MVPSGVFTNADGSKMVTFEEILGTTIQFGRMPVCGEEKAARSIEALYVSLSQLCPCEMRESLNAVPSTQ